jgi:hypothetical protein
MSDFWCNVITILLKLIPLLTRIQSLLCSALPPSLPKDLPSPQYYFTRRTYEHCLRTFKHRKFFVLLSYEAMSLTPHLTTFFQIGPNGLDVSEVGFTHILGLKVRHMFIRVAFRELHIRTLSLLNVKNYSSVILTYMLTVDMILKKHLNRWRLLRYICRRGAQSYYIQHVMSAHEQIIKRSYVV